MGPMLYGITYIIRPVCVCVCVCVCVRERPGMRLVKTENEANESWE